MISLVNHYQSTHKDRSKPRRFAQNVGRQSGQEARVAVLEMGVFETRDRLSKIEARVDTLESKVDTLEYKIDALGARMDTFVTKEEFHRELHGLTWRIMGGATLMVSAVYYIARYVH